jgi:hypothetical protein
MLDAVYELTPGENPGDVEGDLFLLLLSRGCEVCVRTEEKVTKMVRRLPGDIELSVSFAWDHLHAELHTQVAPVDYPAVVHLKDGVERKRYYGVDDVIEYIEDCFLEIRK